MNTKKIANGEIAQLKISSLPTRPTSPRSAGGLGYSSTQMKEAFDKLPLLIIERLNSLIDDVESVGPGSVSASLMTGIENDHSLADLFADLLNGNFAAYLQVGGRSLTAALAEMNSRILALETK